MGIGSYVMEGPDPTMAIAVARAATWDTDSQVRRLQRMVRVAKRRESWCDPFHHSTDRESEACSECDKDRAWAKELARLKSGDLSR